MSTTWIDAVIMVAGSVAGVTSLWLRLRARTAVHLAHIHSAATHQLGPHIWPGSELEDRQRRVCWTMRLPLPGPGAYQPHRYSR